jgi:hypothetical protein
VANGDDSFVGQLPSLIRRCGMTHEDVEGQDSTLVLTLPAPPPSHDTGTVGLSPETAGAAGERRQSAYLAMEGGSRGACSHDPIG